MERIRRHVLSDGDVRVAILSLGCITQEWQVPLGGKPQSVVLGYRDRRAYWHNPCYLGAIVGRVANRVSGAAFDWEGERITLDANEPPHHLHGGSLGLHARNWNMEAEGNRAVQLSLTSPHGEEGYPGKLDLYVTISLHGHRLSYEIEARSDRPTPLNLAQHSYYALGDATLQFPARGYTPTDAQMIPTGQIVSLDGAQFDFNSSKRLSQADPQRVGLDMNFVLDSPDIQARGRGLHLMMETNQPCLQLYTAQHLYQAAEPLEGQKHDPFGAICLEPQGYPNAVKTPTFPISLAMPEQPYHQSLHVTIQPEAI